jgi:hypothetical protein
MRKKEKSKEEEEGHILSENEQQMREQISQL